MVAVAAVAVAAVVAFEVVVASAVVAVVVVEEADWKHDCYHYWVVCQRLWYLLQC